MPVTACKPVSFKSRLKFKEFLSAACRRFKPGSSTLHVLPDRVLVLDGMKNFISGFWVSKFAVS
ncbi:MAG: hypothetical protein WB014_04775, partial [Methanosarcina sp.]